LPALAFRASERLRSCHWNQCKFTHYLPLSCCPRSPISSHFSHLFPFSCVRVRSGRRRPHPGQGRASRPAGGPSPLLPYRPPPFQPLPAVASVPVSLPAPSALLSLHINSRRMASRGRSSSATNRTGSGRERLFQSADLVCILFELDLDHDARFSQLTGCLLLALLYPMYCNQHRRMLNYFGCFCLLF
jgi:hypothetical protein